MAVFCQMPLHCSFIFAVNVFLSAIFLYTLNFIKQGSTQFYELKHTTKFLNIKSTANKEHYKMPP